MNKMLKHLIGYTAAAEILGGDGNLAAKAAFVATPFIVVGACAKGAADGAAAFAARPALATHKPPTVLALGDGRG